MSENIKKKIPFCPLLSAGMVDDTRICLQEGCAWYVTSSKTCAMYVIAHNNILDIKAKQGK